MANRLPDAFLFIYGDPFHFMILRRFVAMRRSLISDKEYLW